MFPMTLESEVFPFRQDNLFVSSGECQGWRPTMEDCLLKSNINNCGQQDAIFGVFDGHGGSDISIISKAVFPKILEWNLQ